MPRRRVTVHFAATLACVACAATLLWTGSSGATTVRVRTGQTLTQIASAYGTTVAALAVANGIENTNLVMVGAALTIPSGASTTGSPSSIGTSSAGTGQASVVAASGDSLWSIAARNGTTVTALAQANGVPATATILVGRRLLLPAGAGAIAGASTAAVPAQRYPALLLASSSRLALVPLFQRWATRFGVPASLLEGTCWWESGWQRSVVSSTGAVGVGQLEPSTVATMRTVLGDATLSATNASDNIEMSAAYLHQLLMATGGNQNLALAGYYQGLVSVRRSGMLPSTVQYVQGVLATAALFA